jgi:hypothetical protein
MRKIVKDSSKKIFANSIFCDIVEASEIQEGFAMNRFDAKKQGFCFIGGRGFFGFGFFGLDKTEHVQGV